ncbi:tetratricopeptide repeat-containing sensor histidine kinase [Pseudoalteromonas umbrosa]|uniref:tetratricopeptide repeat-containing sensor histidine kinase n=1 Tax=Pseudoalteromonas umbrosa TaxID=3048489 RepID=UPI0024C26F4C|nr:tetratricopeptide repeat-containing sensor histidine kinase [Pseudoalteromonas sp. B95]MDK1285800.1 tetratricopeptide repeat-containing sensor histidine kinase [Pseudoalteromonas sp. B95]
MLLRCITWILLFVSLNAFPAAFTETEFEEIRAEIRSASSQSPLEAISTTEYFLFKFDKQLSTRQKIRLLYGKAWFQIQTDDMHSAISTLSQCKKMSIEVSDPTILYSYYSLTAGALTRMGLYERALENYLESYKLAALMDTELFLRQTENNIGNVYLKLSRYEDAKSYFQRFYQDAKQRDLAQQMAVGLNNLGEAHFGLGEYQIALAFHKQSLSLRKQNEFTYHSSWSHHNLGKTYIALGELELAKQHLERATKIRKDSNAIADSIGPQIDLMKIKLSQKAYEGTETRLKEIIKLSDEYTRHQEESEAYQLLKMYYQQINDLQSALDTSALLMQSKLKFLQGQAEIGVAFHAAQMNLAIKERDIAKLTQENAIHQLNTQAVKTQLIIMIIAMVIIILLTGYFVRRIKSKNLVLIKTLDNLKATQKQLLEAEKMAAMTTLVSGMAHQLNTPLGLVVTSASCLEEKLKEIRQLLSDQTLSATQLKIFLEEASEMLALTANNSGRAADMIARFKQIATNLDTSDASNFEVLGFLTQRCTLISQSIEPDIVLTVTGDTVDIHSHPETLIKVISQLVNNSCAHGFIQQSSKHIDIEVKDGSNHVLITYQDNGIGISEDDQKHMFDPFYTSQLGEGNLGLGLNIAYNSVVHILNGEIGYEHQTNGVKFVINIPKKSQNTRVK